jgi:hypothetical protein
MKMQPSPLFTPHAVNVQPQRSGAHLDLYLTPNKLIDLEKMLKLQKELDTLPQHERKRPTQELAEIGLTAKPVKSSNILGAALLGVKEALHIYLNDGTHANEKSPIRINATLLNNKSGKLEIETDKKHPIRFAHAAEALANVDNATLLPSERGAFTMEASLGHITWKETARMLHYTLLNKASNTPKKRSELRQLHHLVQKATTPSEEGQAQLAEWIEGYKKLARYNIAKATEAPLETP